MKMIKEYLLSVCVVYTILALGKVLIEGIGGMQDPYYVMNFGILFVITCYAAFILFMHRIFHKVPLLFVMIGQYVLVIGGVMAGIFIMSKFMEVSPAAYRDMFIQITLPYIVFAGIYYIAYFREIKKANEIIKAIKGPIPYAKMMPTGGVSVDNVAEWIKAGAVAVGAGGALTAGAKTGDFASITKIGREFVQKIKEARGL